MTRCNVVPRAPRSDPRSSPLPCGSLGAFTFHMTGIQVTSAVIALAGLLLALLALLVYRWGYRAGIESGRRTLEAYKAGQEADGGCWVKHRPSDSPQ